MVENIYVIWEGHLDALTKIHEMSPQDKDCCIHSYNKFIKKSQGFGNQDSKVSGVCTKVGNYIDTIIEELKVQKLEIGGQILTCNELWAKLQDDHMNMKMEIR